MRTIGVLGGIGPQATLDFETRVHEAAQRVIPPHWNEGYPPMVTVHLRHPPVVMLPDGVPREPLTLDPRVPDAVAKLGCWVDLIVIPCNTPHLFLDQIRKAAGCEVLSIVDVTVDELQARGGSPVGLVGFGVPLVYRDRFEREGLPSVIPPRELRGRLDAAILRLMEGRETDHDREAAREAVEFVRSAGASLTVLGCTEIPLLLGADADAADLVNPAQLLAEAAVQRAVR